MLESQQNLILCNPVVFLLINQVKWAVEEEEEEEKSMWQVTNPRDQVKMGVSPIHRVTSAPGGPATVMSLNLHH